MYIHYEKKTSRMMTNQSTLVLVKRCSTGITTNPLQCRTEQFYWEQNAKKILAEPSISHLRPKEPLYFTATKKHHTDPSPKETETMDKNIVQKAVFNTNQTFLFSS